MISGGALSKQQDVVLALVTLFPGSTAKELSEQSFRVAWADALGPDRTARRHAISRRLPELSMPTEKHPERLGMIRGEDTGEREMRWWQV